MEQLSRTRTSKAGSGSESADKEANIPECTGSWLTPRVKADRAEDEQPVEKSSLHPGTILLENTHPSLHCAYFFTLIFMPDTKKRVEERGQT